MGSMQLHVKRRVLVAVCLMAFAARSAPSQTRRAESCSVSAGPSRRLELSDGRIVSVDAKSVAASGGSIMALGPYVYTFPRNSTPTTSPIPGDSTIGLLIEASGIVSLVPSPVRDRSVAFARAAAGPSNSFHVLFVTGVDSLFRAPAPDDSATIWYAQFANGAWDAPRRVMETRGAALNPEFTSELLARDGSLALVFPFVDFRSDETSGGLVALRRTNGRWSSDTLRTYLKPPAARAKYAGSDTLVVLFSQRERSVRAETVFLSRVGADWNAPEKIGGNGIRPVSDLALMMVPGGMVASWSTWQWLNGASNVLEWRRLTRDGSSPTAAVIDSGAATYPFELAEWADRYPLWLYHGEPHGAAVSYALAVDDRLQYGRLTMPFDNSRPKALTVSPERSVVLTMKRGRDGAEPMIASWMTDLRIRCPRSERR